MISLLWHLARLWLRSVLRTPAAPPVLPAIEVVMHPPSPPERHYPVRRAYRIFFASGHSATACFDVQDVSILDATMANGFEHLAHKYGSPITRIEPLEKPH